MTRRNIIFKDSNGNLYVTPEFNGDKREFELRKIMDSYSKNWEDVLKDFEGITTLKDFKTASKQAQEYGTSFLGYIEILPVKEIETIEEIQNDEVYLLENGVITQII